MFYDAEGRPLSVHENTEHVRRALASFEVEVTEGQGAALIRTTKVRFVDKLKAIELIARLAGYLKTETAIGGEFIVRWADK
jgi:hypothetical protein